MICNQEPWPTWLIEGCNSREPTAHNKSQGSCGGSCSSFYLQCPRFLLVHFLPVSMAAWLTGIPASGHLHSGDSHVCDSCPLARPVDLGVHPDMVHTRPSASQVLQCSVGGGPRHNGSCALERVHPHPNCLGTCSFLILHYSIL